MIIFAAGRGVLDEVPVDRVREFEGKFLAFMRQTHPEVGAAIVKEKDISADTEKTLLAVAADFRQAFLSGKAPEPRAASATSPTAVAAR